MASTRCSMPMTCTLHCTQRRFVYLYTVRLFHRCSTVAVISMASLWIQTRLKLLWSAHDNELTVKQAHLTTRQSASSQRPKSGSSYQQHTVLRRTCWQRLQDKLLPPESTTSYPVIACSIIHIWLDYCNSVLYIKLAVNLNRLQCARTLLRES